MLPIMTTGREKERRQMIQDALEAKAPKTFRELKKAKKMEAFLINQEEMMMLAFREEQSRITFDQKNELQPGENPIQQVQRIEMDLLTAWHQTLETYLDFSD